MNRKKDLLGLSAKILLENIDNLGNEILHVVNKSMTEGSFPKTLKKSIVIPVPKVSNPKTAVEYRPINMLPTLEKVIEKVVSKQLTKFVQDNNIIIRQQSGFRKGHSCETALIWIIHEWKKRIDVGDKVLAIFLDFKRAFETIDRGILIQKLEGYGVRGVENKWFESYLCGRSQQTKIMEFTSQEEHVDIGVPQGSTLGVDLFLLYINEINTVLKWCNIALFADDTLLYIADKNLSDIHNKVQEDLKNLEIWLCMNKLKLNTDKTKFMILNSNENMRLQIGCESLGEVSTIKYLGVIIDKQLNFNEHAGYICNKISKKVGFLSRIRKRLSFDNAIMIFNTIILPHFDYCATILYMCNNDIKKRLQVLQNKAMRVIIKCNIYTSTSSMLQMLMWLNVKQRLALRVLVFVFNVKHSMFPEYLQDELVYVRDIQPYNLRRANDFRLGRFNKRSTQNSIMYNGLKLFNTLPDVIKNENNLLHFRKLVVDFIKLNIN